jgi:hypothetical protein
MVLWELPETNLIHAWLHPGVGDFFAGRKPLKRLGVRLKPLVATTKPREAACES